MKALANYMWILFYFSVLNSYEISVDFLFFAVGMRSVFLLIFFCILSNLDVDGTTTAVCTVLIIVCIVEGVSKMCKMCEM